MAKLWERKWEDIGSSQWCGPFVTIVVGEPIDSRWDAPIFFYSYLLVFTFHMHSQ